MNYYTIHGIDPLWLKAKFLKYMDILEKSHFTLAATMKIQRRTLLAFEMAPEKAQYKTVHKIHKWVKEIEAKISGQSEI